MRKAEFEAAEAWLEPAPFKLDTQAAMVEIVNFHDQWFPGICSESRKTTELIARSEFRSSQAKPSTFGDADLVPYRPGLSDQDSAVR